jgi:hypothetical protein
LSSPDAARASVAVVILRDRAKKRPSHVEGTLQTVLLCETQGGTQKKRSLGAKSE